MCRQTSCACHYSPTEDRPSSSVRAGIVTYLDITACGTMCIGCLQVLCLFVGATEASHNFCASVSPATKSSFHIESEGPCQILHSFSESFPSHLSGNCLSSYLLSFFFFIGSFLPFAWFSKYLSTHVASCQLHSQETLCVKLDPCS